MFKMPSEPDAPVGSLTRTEVLEELANAAVVLDAVGLRRLDLLGELDARELHRVEGAPTAATFLTMTTDVARSVAMADVRDARKLRARPAVAEAARTMGLGKARIVLRGLTDATADAFAADEAVLVENVAKMTEDDARRYIAAWRHLNTPDVEPEGVGTLYASMINDTLELRGSIHGADGLAVKLQIDALARQIRDAAKG